MKDLRVFRASFIGWLSRTRRIIGWSLRAFNVKKMILVQVLMDRLCSAGKKTCFGKTCFKLCSPSEEQQVVLAEEEP